ncbi:MAG: DegT/DnrJ/EryC1/StrS family aminotransferase, partial [Muribaculaceae bacterium]|nr:DegT/DnrJ/EryC1/StrS family aminotransferase [Muribaculaceae bacterium]
VNAPYLAEIKEAVTRVIDSGWYIGGPEVEGLEQELKGFIGAEHAIGVSNGLDALRLILRGYIELGRLKPGDEVIVNANTYIASVLAITDCGLRPVLAEPSPLTANLTAETIAQALRTSNARAVMLVHLYGRTAWDDDIARVVADNNLLVIEDVAQAIGARYYDKDKTVMTGAIGDAGAFSFYPTKNIGAMGDAGAVTTSDTELATVIKALRNYGSDYRYHNIYAGLNCRLDPVQAAILRVKLPYTDRENTMRREVAHVYDQFITNPLVTKPLYVDDFSMVWHQYAVLVDDRERFRGFLADRGVATDVNYPKAVHQQPCYTSLAPDGSLPAAEDYCRRVVSLPISSCTSVDDAAQIAAIINQYQ